MRLLLAMAALAAGCTTAPKLTSDKLINLKQGMTKTEVIQQLGQPKSVSSQNNEELLVYAVEGAVVADDYLVLLADGKVLRYGRPVDMNQNK